jgi:hypothetical protein
MDLIISKFDMKWKFSLYLNYHDTTENDADHQKQPRLSFSVIITIF